MDTQHNGQSRAATWFAISEVDCRRQSVTRMFERAWSAQQKSKTTGAFASMFAGFVKSLSAPFGVHTEIQSASEVGLWHRERLRDIRKLPLMGDVHCYPAGERRKILFVLFDCDRLRVLTD